MMSSNIIYKYSCGQCQSSYIGETHRHFMHFIIDNDLLKKSKALKYISENDFHRFFGPAPKNL